MQLQMQCKDAVLPQKYREEFLPSAACTSWKFFTDACVTLPWKFRTYAWVSAMVARVTVKKPENRLS